MKGTLFISGDWGTSNFRVRLVDRSTLKVIAEHRSNDGIASMNSRWSQQNDQNPGSRESFYLQFLAHAIGSWSELDTEPAPMVLSGMASSTLGLKELPYASTPYSVTGKDAIVKWIPASNELKQPLLLVSGVRSQDDVMRGEETQLTGLVSLMKNLPGSSKTFVLPGTHSKHIRVNGEAISDFKTFMTGELFALLSTQSVLKNSVELTTLSDMQPKSIEAFRKGIEASGEGQLLHSLFKVRTNQLFGRFAPIENASYLSGLLIGTELRPLKKGMEALVLAGEASLVQWYEEAFQQLHLDDRVTVVPIEEFERALLAGQRELLITHTTQ